MKDKKDKIKFRFGESLLLSRCLSCKNCKFANDFDYNREVCPVLHYSYDVGLVITENDTWWATSHAENISVIMDDVAEAFRAYKDCKKLAAKCMHNKARQKTK